MKLRIKEARERAEYTQTELASLIGVAPNTFCGYENGLHDPKSRLLIKIAQECGTTTDYLLGLADDPSPNLENKKSPSPEGVEDSSISVDEMKVLLRRLGLIGENDDITEKDAAFVSGIIDLLEAWFNR